MWAKDGAEKGYADALELLDLALHLVGDEVGVHRQNF